MKQVQFRLYPSGLQRITPCPRVLRSKDLPSSHSDQAAREGLDPRLPDNGRMSCRSTTWHRCTATGSRTPLSGLRARCLGLWTIAACRRVSSGSGATRTPRGLATRTCFRDRLLIRPDDFRLQVAGAGIEPTPERSERPVLPLDDPASITKVRGAGLDPASPVSKPGSLPLADPRILKVPCGS